MRVIDDDGHLVLGRRHELESTRYTSEVLNPALDGVERNIGRGGGRRGRQDVVDVGPADQLRADVQSAARRADIELQAFERVGKRTWRNVSGPRDRIRDRSAARVDECRAPRIVDVD